MTLDTNDLGVLVHITKRERPIGAPEWDDQGVVAFLRRLDNAGFGFGEILDRVIAHRRDKNARTPAVLMTSISATAAAPTTPRNPTRTEQCTECGRRRAACICDPMVKKKPPVDSTAPDVQAALADARAKILAAKGVSA